MGGKHAEPDSKIPVLRLSSLRFDCYYGIEPRRQNVVSRHGGVDRYYLTRWVWEPTNGSAHLRPFDPGRGRRTKPARLPAPSLRLGHGGGNGCRNHAAHPGRPDPWEPAKLDRAVARTGRAIHAACHPANAAQPERDLS